MFLGFVILAFGAWLVNSAVQNRKPLETLRDIVKSPVDYRRTLDNAKGSGFRIATYMPSQTPGAGAIPVPSSGPGAATTKGKYWWSSGKGAVSQEYGAVNSRYASGRHDGLDVAMASGTKLYALTDGTVVYSGDAGADGLRIGIRTDAGPIYYYGHMSVISVGNGQRVKRGTPVGLSGATGNVTGPHVHFELDVNNDKQGDNPYAFLAGNS